MHANQGFFNTWKNFIQTEKLSTKGFSMVWVTIGHNFFDAGEGKGIYFKSIPAVFLNIDNPYVALYANVMYFWHVLHFFSFNFGVTY